MPPPAPASAPQVNCPVAASQRSLELESEQAVSPAPVKVPETYMVELVALVEEALVAKSEVKVFCALNELVVVVENAVVKAPVELLYASGYVAEREEEEILLLKVVKSAEER